MPSTSTPLPFELQRLVDNLGDRLGRSVAVDDRNARLLAYSAYAGGPESGRVRPIPQREVSQELVAFLQTLGAFNTDDLFMVPVRTELGVTVERISMPVRYQGALHGFLWLLASDGPLAADEISAVRQAAAHVAELLHRNQALDELQRARVREQMRNLLSGDVRLHRSAVEWLVEEELVAAGPVTSLVVTIPRKSDQPLSERDRLALAVGLERGCRRAPPRSAIHMERADHGVVIVAPSGATERDVDDLAGTVQQSVCAEAGCSLERCFVGIGQCRTDLCDAYGSYLEARLAVDVARVVRVLGTVVRYSRLGVYALLADLPVGRLRSSIHPGLQRLLDHDVGDSIFVETLEVFLDNAGDVKRTAEHLSLHRASVYYRLRRIEEIASVDLSCGEDRLALHVGLKVSQLIELR